VLTQNYHHLRYVVVDGGSTDQTLEILRGYEDRIDQIVTGGPAAAMEAVAQAFEDIDGDVLSFLLPGDVLEPGGVMRVGEYFARRAAATDEAYAADVARAREAFERGFGAAGRARCRVIHVAHRAFDALRSLSPASRLFFPLAPDGPLPPAEAPPAAPGQPICPLSDRPPDRLLFSTRDTVGGDRGVHHVYYDSASGSALACPPLPPDRQAALYARR